MLSTPSLPMHRYPTRFQMKKMAVENKKRECDIIQSRLVACHQSPCPKVSFTIFEKVCNVFDDLTTMNLWKTHPRFNTVVRNKMAEFRNQIHLIHTHDGRVVGVVIDKVTVIYDEMYLYPVKQMFSVMDRLEKTMNEYAQKQ